MNSSQPLNPQSQLQEEFLKQLDDLITGQIVEGSVVQVGDEFVFIDIGYKSEGRVAIEEFASPPVIGDTVHVMLLSKDISQGGIAVSKQRADQEIHWINLERAYRERTPIEGVILRCVNQGFEVDLEGGLRGFVPLSKIDIYKADNPESYEQTTARFHIEQLYTNDRVNIVLSRRSVLIEQMRENRERFFETHTVGDHVHGVVKSFTSFGAFIDLGGFDGLLHLNDMSWGHATRPRDYVRKSQELELVVITVSRESGKINLSLREMTGNPWDTFEQRYHVDDIVEGVVKKLVNYGVFFELEPGIEGLAHVSELLWSQHVNSPGEIFKVGDRTMVKILQYDLEKRRIALGVKQTQPHPWDDIETRYQPNSMVHGIVRKIIAIGAIVELEPGITGLIHTSDFAWGKRQQDPSQFCSEGQEIDCLVLSVDQEQRRMRLSLKQMGKDPWIWLSEAKRQGTIVEGTITNINQHGVFVEVYEGVEGLVNRQNLSEPDVVPFEQAAARLKPGDRLRVVITDVKPSVQKVALSVRELERREQGREIARYLHNEEEPDTIKLGDLLRDKQHG